MGYGTTTGLAVLLAVAGLGCSPSEQRRDTTAAAQPSADRADGVKTPPQMEMLPTPFSAEQIRDEWVAGLEVVMRRRTSSDEAFERWRVVAADAEGVEIEVVPVDAAGEPAGEMQTRRSTWTELRDHARYPTSVAARERVTRDTPLGELEGWLYTLSDPKAGTTSELFFADALPGAPVEMTVRSSDQVMFELAQIRHERPTAAPGA